MEVCHLEVGFEVSKLHRRTGVSLSCVQAGVKLAGTPPAPCVLPGSLA